MLGFLIGLLMTVLAWSGSAAADPCPMHMHHGESPAIVADADLPVAGEAFAAPDELRLRGTMHDHATHTGTGGCCHLITSFDCVTASWQASCLQPHLVVPAEYVLPKPPLRTLGIFRPPAIA